MDFKTLLPDFNAIGKTEWGKPSVDTKDTMNLVALVGVVLMVVFVFLPWAKLTVSALGESAEGSRLGITLWYGIFGLICALAALVGVLYKHTSLTFCAAVLGLVFGLIGLLSVPDFTIAGEKVTSDEVKTALEASKLTKVAGVGGASISHLGAILYMVASGVTAVAAYLKIAKK